MKRPQHLAELIEKCEAGTASPEEVAALNEWYHSFDDSVATVSAAEQITEAELGQRIQSRLRESMNAAKAPAVYRRGWFRAAAAILLIITVAGYFIYRNGLSETAQVAAVPVTPAPAEIVPGGNKAVLILADGSSIVLDSASNGLLSTQGNIQVEKLDNGLLAYTVNGKILYEDDAAFYNTISTPRGGQYQVTLSDGTKVWLNAASSIRFPVLFTGTERRVEVTGEAYFEVARDISKPFKVKAAQSEVEVLGTHFNINAYDDEVSIKTTLLEGKVKITVPGQAAAQPARFLQPGQQSGISKNGEISIVKNADTDEAIAWLKGRFQFENTDLRSMLRQISRWYDVDVEYRGAVDLHFTGQLTRNENVTNVFKQLALTGEVHFRIEGRKVIVTR